MVYLGREVSLILYYSSVRMALKRYSQDECKYYECGDKPEQLCIDLYAARQCASAAAGIYHFYSVENVIHTIESNTSTIESVSQEFDVPASLIAGVLATEMFWDYDGGDVWKDLIIGCHAGPLSDSIGPGIANVHGHGYQPAQGYLEDLGYSSDRLNDIGDCNNLNTTKGAIEAVGVISRYLMDEYGHGNNLGTEDMALIFAAYRQSPDNISEKDSSGNVITTFSEYLSKRELPGNGCFALPFMTYMMEQFGNN